MSEDASGQEPARAPQRAADPGLPLALGRADHRRARRGGRRVRDPDHGRHRRPVVRAGDHRRPARLRRPRRRCGGSGSRSVPPVLRRRRARARGVGDRARRAGPRSIACATVPGAVLLVEAILKPLVDRRVRARTARSTTRPAPRRASRRGPRSTWLLAVPVGPPSRPAARRWRSRSAALTTLTAVAVVATDKHLPLDAVGGVAVGMAVVLACAAIIDLVTGAHRRTRFGDVRTVAIATRSTPRNE